MKGNIILIDNVQRVYNLPQLQNKLLLCGSVDNLFWLFTSAEVAGSNPGRCSCENDLQRLIYHIDLVPYINKLL